MGPMTVQNSKNFLVKGIALLSPSVWNISKAEGYCVGLLEQQLENVPGGFLAIGQLQRESSSIRTDWKSAGTVLDALAGHDLLVDIYRTGPVVTTESPG